MKISKRILALVLSVVLIGTFFAGCEKREQGEDPSSGTNQSSTTEKPGDKDKKTIESILPDHMKNVAERKEENEDTVGWLEVPMTGIEDVVVWSPKDNEYYKRLNFNKNYEFDGVYYADYRSKFSPDDGYDGSIDALPLNVVIYGHAMTDTPEHEKYSVKFGPLHDLRDPDFAADVPYLFFTTESGNYVYEIFAQLVVNADNSDVPYNHPNSDPEDFYKMIQEEVLPRSVLDYDVELAPDDKYITLSTCIYHLPGHEDEPEMPYPNYYRYAIMGRLVKDIDQPLKETVKVKENKKIVLDPSGPMGSAK